jgi:hypothetical protein
MRITATADPLIAFHTNFLFTPPRFRLAHRQLQQLDSNFSAVAVIVAAVE